jgi:lipoprotein-anchoring transpeptidase ErfK/SrfK
MRILLLLFLLCCGSAQAHALEILVDQAARKLYLIEDGKVQKTYPVAVGRDGFRWSGVHTITQKKLDPDWYPPPEMRARQPNLPARMAGGPGNPLGDAALYIGNTQYRIHGTYVPSKIGLPESSGCFRMTNGHVMELYNSIPLGTKITVR